MEERLIVEQFDPELPVPGGVDTCIRGLVQYCPPGVKLRIAGVDAIGNKRIGSWSEFDIGGRTVEFMPLAQIDYTDMKRRIPHSAWVAAGLRKYRAALDADVIQSHRLNTGAVAMKLFPSSRHVQFIHRGSDLEKERETFFRYAMFSYRWLERYVIPRTVDTVVFNRDAAQRLNVMAEQVRFSPTWYDPADFFPADPESREKRRIIWVGRIEPGKNLDLAIDVLGKLPEGYTLSIAGAGSLEASMRERARRSQAADRISFLGSVPKAHVGEVMRQHDLMLMTSSFEGFSRAIVEGLASGLPVVTTSGAEPNGLVTDGSNGARVDGSDPASFVPAVELASKLSSSVARESVSALNAKLIVPRVLATPPDDSRGANSGVFSGQD
jgi:glycosyltransferase involved in cell wall biosynthesis